MSTPEDKAAADIAKVKAWYKQYPFYAGMICGAILLALALRFL